MIKNIVFDMGNVLLKYEPAVYVEKLCETQEAKDLIYKELFCGAEWLMTDEGVIDPDERFEAVARRIPQKYHGDLERCNYQWSKYMYPVKGAKEFLSYVKENGYGLYIISNAAKDFYSYFTPHYDIDFFDGVVVSSDIHLLKPGREIFDYFLEKYSLTADECLFIDDCEPNVITAKHLGMNAVVFRDNYDEIRKILG